MITFGDWQVDEYGMSNFKLPHNPIRIPKANLGIIVLKDKLELYKAMLDLNKYAWLTEACIIDFNDAYLYALGYFKIEFNELVFGNSKSAQQNEMVIKRITHLLKSDEKRK